jgi:hypothetical protein
MTINGYGIGVGWCAIICCLSYLGWLAVGGIGLASWIFFGIAIIAVLIAFILLALYHNEHE